jgi:hypothetical protein
MPTKTKTLMMTMDPHLKKRVRFQEKPEAGDGGGGEGERRRRKQGWKKTDRQTEKTTDVGDVGKLRWRLHEAGNKFRDMKMERDKEDNEAIEHDQ